MLAGSNWSHGHWGGARGVAHYSGWVTTSANTANLTNWLVFCGKNEDRLINRKRIVWQMVYMLVQVLVVQMDTI